MVGSMWGRHPICKKDFYAITKVEYDLPKVKGLSKLLTLRSIIREAKQ